MKGIVKKTIIILSMLVMIISFTGCYHHKEYSEAKKTAKKMALRHIKEKYNIEGRRSKIDRVFVDPLPGYGGPSSPSGDVIVRFKDGYSVYVDLNRHKTYDDIQIPKLKKDIIAKFIDANKFLNEYYIRTLEVSQISPRISLRKTFSTHFLDKATYYNGDLNKFFDMTDNRITLRLTVCWKSDADGTGNLYIEENKRFVDVFKDNFKGPWTTISSVVFRKERYLSEKSKAVTEYQNNGGWSHKHDNIYSFMNIKNRVTVEYNYRTEEELKALADSRHTDIADIAADFNQWHQTIIYPNYVTLEPGLEVASPYGCKIFHKPDDVFYQKVKCGQMHSEEFDKIVALNKSKISNPYLDSNIVSHGNGNEIEIVHDLYLVSYLLKDIENSDITAYAGVIIKIDKKTFLNGILNEGYEVVFPWNFSTEKAPFLRKVVASNQFYEDEDVLHFSKKNRQPFTIVKAY